MSFLNLMRNRLKPKEVNDALLNNTVPSHSVSDAGKYLGVDSSGGLEFSNPLPAVTGAADEGKVLTVNSSGEWVPVNPSSSYNLDYSTTEKDTGKKWIDGRPIYSKVFNQSGMYLSTSYSYTGWEYSGDNVISSVGFLSDGRTIPILIRKSSGGEIEIASTDTYNNVNVYVIIEYTKTTTSKRGTKK